MTWSTDSCAWPGCFPQYWHLERSRRIRFLRVKGSDCLGIPLNEFRTITSGMQSLSRTVEMLSSPSGTSRRDQLSKSWTSKVSGWTTSAASE